MAGNVLLAGVGVLLLAGCLPATRTASASPDALRDAAARWEQAIEAKDASRIALSFAEDATAMYPQSMPTIGREANRQAWERVYRNPTVEHPITIDEVHVSESGDLGYVFGRWWYRTAGKDVNSGGRYLTVWKPVQGEWQVVMLSAQRHEDISADRSSR